MKAFNISSLSPEFILAMVTSMYHFEAVQTATMENIDELLSTNEIEEFYCAFLSI